MSYFLRKLTEASQHNKSFGCTLANMCVKKEIRKGFSSIIVFFCNMCNMTVGVPTHNMEDNSVMDMNSRAVAGVMGIGAGYSQLQELCAAVGVPCMAPATYSKHHDVICNGWEKAASEKMEEAAREEAELARANDEVDENNIPLITVVVDGSWCKRSYKCKYDALSGVAAIVGYRTKKVLFMAVANKYCYVCARAKNNESIPSHDCYKNHEGSSSSMEAKIIVEGFKKSVTMYNIKYAKIIADGDSSVYKKILEARPYDNLTVEKIECRNHLLRNYRKKIISASENTNLGTTILRKIVYSKMSKLSIGVQKAIAYRKSQDTDFQVKVSQLKCDIENGPSHVFGEHKNCSTLGYFCDGRKDGESNLVPELEKNSLWSHIYKACQYLAAHSRSLIHDVDSNKVEQFNSIIAKFSGGKRVNFATKRSYQGRCAGAVIAHNTKTPQYVLHKSMFNGISPNKISKRLEFRRRELRRRELEIKEKNKQIKSTKTAKKSLTKTYGEKDYGPQCQQPDMDPETFEEQKQAFLSRLQLTQEDRQQLERDTILQAGSGKWLETRRKILTASNFGKVCRRRASTSCANLVRSIVYTSDILNVPAIYHGKKFEVMAIEQLEKQEGIKVGKSGLFIDKELPFLGATPDGVIGEKGLAEVKCPSSAIGKDVTAAVKQGNIRYLSFEGDELKLKKTHSYFYQVQGQLHISEREYCIFGVWTSVEKEMAIFRIERDDNFWKQEMEPHLTKFYYNCILPELVDPRHTRSMEIRDPPYIIDAIEKRARKKFAAVKTCSAAH
ncbi:uncharacterized protein LOC134533104 [Bacillus rossius redtenbacheri]|uniref:uncharacterized protein LOC134533104 n=1 Tax=Bacillus rossius redtenbacheri TaxID=93214 RepID=UPI002FDE292D